MTATRRIEVEQRPNGECQAVAEAPIAVPNDQVPSEFLLLHWVIAFLQPTAASDATVTIDLDSVASDDTDLKEVAWSVREVPNVHFTRYQQRPTRGLPVTCSIQARPLQSAGSGVRIHVKPHHLGGFART